MERSVPFKGTHRQLSWLAIAANIWKCSYINLPSFLSFNTIFSWNKFRDQLNETVVRDTAALLKSTGLAAKGYVYVNMSVGFKGGRNTVYL